MIIVFFVVQHLNFIINGCVQATLSRNSTHQYVTVDNVQDCRTDVQRQTLPMWKGAHADATTIVRVTLLTAASPEADAWRIVEVHDLHYNDDVVVASFRAGSCLAEQPGEIALLTEPMFRANDVVVRGFTIAEREQFNLNMVVVQLPDATTKFEVPFGCIDDNGVFTHASLCTFAPRQAGDDGWSLTQPAQSLTGMSSDRDRQAFIVAQPVLLLSSDFVVQLELLMNDDAPLELGIAYDHHPLRGVRSLKIRLTTDGDAVRAVVETTDDGITHSHPLSDALPRTSSIGVHCVVLTSQVDLFAPAVVWFKADGGSSGIISL
jgi:hypothetical protein